MKQYEYLKVRAAALMEKDSVDIAKLDKYGSEGWELCYVTNWNGKAAWFYFKREKQ